MNIENKILTWFEKDEKNRSLLKWFNNDNQNQELLKLYNSKKEMIKEIEALNNELGYGKLSLLLSSIPPNYQKSKYKIMVIGQELNGGYGIKSEPKITMLDNLKSQTSKSSGNNFFSFPARFCHTVNKLGDKLNKKEIRSYFIWAEIRKFSYWKPVRKPAVNKKPNASLNNKVQQLIYAKFNILEDEIRIINPDIVLFLIGPKSKYLESICNQLKGVKFKKIDNWKERELVKVEHPILKGRKAFRLYHPGYLKRKGLENKYLEELVKQCSL